MLYRELLKFWSNQTFGRECTCHICLNKTKRKWGFQPGRFSLECPIYIFFFTYILWDNVFVQETCQTPWQMVVRCAASRKKSLLTRYHIIWSTTIRLNGRNSRPSTIQQAATKNSISRTRPTPPEQEDKLSSHFSRGCFVCYLFIFFNSSFYLLEPL